MLSQSQSTERLFITFTNSMFGWAASTALAASAMLSRKSSCAADCQLSRLAPAEWMSSLPSRDAMPIEMFFSAPPKPAIMCPLKCESTTMAGARRISVAMWTSLKCLPRMRTGTSFSPNRPSAMITGAPTTDGAKPWEMAVLM